jgi:parvulin-like peptidyl-prolyl cis-trans isomerase-like protein
MELLNLEIYFLRDFYMTKYIFLCLLFGALASGQTAPPAPAQPAGTAVSSSPDPASKIAPDTPVITINGVCDHPPADKQASSCKKVITRAQFELMIQAVHANVSPGDRRQFANHYVSALVQDQMAREKGLDQGPDYDERMRIAHSQVLAQELNLTVYAHASQVPDQQIEDYYKQNPARYTEAELTRILVPGIQQLPAPKEKLSEDEQQKRNQASEAIMKAEADKVRERALAGEDFAKLQAEAFQLAEIKDEAPSTSMGKVRGDNLPSSQLSVMDLKPGEISPLLLDRAGYVIFKVGAKRILPLSEVREDIRKTVVEQRRQAEIDAILKSATPSYDETYFGK